MKVYDCADENGRTVEMRCKRGHKHRELVTPPDCEPRPGEHTLTEIKRGLPCPTCLEQAMRKDNRLI
jgi:hypothetical protein